MYVLGVVLFALGICVSVALHEAGHLFAAKTFGMKVRRYFIGFGPKVFSVRRGETEYGLKWIPLGGFCDIAGMTNLDEVSTDEAPRAMRRYPVWKRTVVMVAGSVTHFILGFIVLYLLATTLGLPNVFGKATISSVTKCVEDGTTRQTVNNPTCEPSDPQPAAAAELQPGDKIISVGGVEVSGWVDMVFAVRDSAGPTRFKIIRDGEKVTVTIDVATVVRPVLSQEEKTADTDGDGLVEVGAIGVAKANYLTYGAFSAIGGAFSYTGEIFQRTWEGILRIPQKVPEVISAILGEQVQNRPVSIVGASQIGGEFAQAGLWAMFLFLLAILNFFVGVFNLIPLLPLDGGHLAVIWYEKLRDGYRKAIGKQPAGPADYSKLGAVTAVAIVIGGCFVLLTVIADIVNPIIQL